MVEYVSLHDTDAGVDNSRFLELLFAWPIIDPLLSLGAVVFVGQSWR